MLKEIKKRNGDIVPFTTEKITIAMRKAFSSEGVSVDDATLEQMTDRVNVKLETSVSLDDLPTVERVQDLVEETLMERGYFRVAKHYILYRFQHAKERKEQIVKEITENRLVVEKSNGSMEPFSREKVRTSLSYFVRGYETDINLDEIVKQIELEVYDGIKTKELAHLVTLVLRARIERDPAYALVAARQLASRLYKEAIGKDVFSKPSFVDAYREGFAPNVRHAVAEGKLDPRMESFDLARLSAAIAPERDDLLRYLGVETLHDRYFIRDREKRALETPQYMWMRVAMGLALGEADKEARALEFYELMSTLRFVPSTPTLFHAGTPHPQLSSCYLNTVNDDLEHIFKVYGDNAQLSKWAGGIGTDWTNIRGTGALLKSSGITSQGVIPFLKIANDVTVAINRSGRRRGATCVYMENWHYDFEDFLELRKNTGDERRRTHDMNTATWVSDLFMKRVRADGQWVLFSPEEAAGLHDSYGRAFETLYEQYESMVDRGEIKLFKKMKARDLWKKMLGTLFETGHPWITFKDPSNIRSPQDHAGVVHNSNLCTEITLNTSAEETAVCNLGSVNYARHITDGVFDTEKVRATVTTAMRMLDNVIDLNFYPTKEAKTSNMRHRPVGLGVMGFHDALYQQNIDFASPEAVTFSDTSMETIAYYAILGSTDLARERGAYESFKGSKWDRGILPVDTLALVENERGMPTGVSREERLDWSVVRDAIKAHGMRNSNTMAIAPTATIANIAGVVPGIEPIYKNMYVKANISGDFVIVNPYLVTDLKALSLWSDEMLHKLKYHDGSIQDVPEIPENLKNKYRETFEIDMRWIIRGAAARGKWIDQSQSLNIFFNGTSGEELSELYLFAWESGLKTTYYLRTLAATQVEKSTVDSSGTQQREHKSPKAEQPKAPTPAPIPSPMPTISPLTKESVEQGKVAVVAGGYRLHVAEEALCEGCQ